MVARLSDPKALVFAHTDLVDMGVPASCLHVHFDEVGGASQPQEEHHSFMKELRDWLTSPHTHGGIAANSSMRPRSPLFKESGGVLEIGCRAGDDTDIVQVIVHHSGTLVA